MDEQSQAAMIHELTMAITGAVAVNVLWWLSVMVVGVAFPFMQYLLAFFLLTYLAVVDRRQFPGEVSTKVYGWRALTNLAIFFSGLVLLGPLGILLSTTVPTGIIPFILSSIAIASIIAVVRCTIISMILISRLTKSNDAPVYELPPPPRIVVTVPVPHRNDRPHQN